MLEKSLVIPPPQITPDVLQALTECNNLTHYQSIDKVSFDLLTHISPTTPVQFFNQLFKPRTSTGCIYYDITTTNISVLSVSFPLMTTKKIHIDRSTDTAGIIELKKGIALNDIPFRG